MSGVKIVCGCAAILALGGQISAMAPEKRAALWTSLSLVVGHGTVAPKSSIPAPPPQAATVAPLRAAGPGYDAVVVPPDRYGQFQTMAEIEGQHLPVLIDTGASFVVLTFEDADRLGIRPLPADYRYMSSTANGNVAFAKADLAEIRLGQIAVRDVTVFAAPRGALSRTLIGMNFLSRLRGFRVEDGRLVLQP